MAGTTILRGRLFHTPRNPFAEDRALEAVADGAVAFRDGAILASGAYAQVRAAHPDARVAGEPGDILLPGLVDAHVHYPQVEVIGAMGLRLLEWLETRTLPAEARLADPGRARAVARAFVRRLAANGTTTALVFGAHFPAAQEELFRAASDLGLRVASGLVVSDRNLLEELHLDPARAYEESRALMERWHGRGRIRYAVTPRFSLSCSDELLAACGALARERPDVLFTSHLNENADEIAAVAELFPADADYLATYERHGLLAARTVLAHDVHPTGAELRRLAAARAAVAHCPSSNAFLGSGIFPLRRHLDHGVAVALGTDVGAGTGLSLLKEALMAYHVQMVAPAGRPLAPAELLYLATRAGAEALGLDAEVGDLAPGRRADVVTIRPRPDSTLAAVLAESPSPEAELGALFTLGREDCVAEVRVDGELVHAAAGLTAPART